MKIVEITRNNQILLNRGTIINYYLLKFTLYVIGAFPMLFIVYHKINNAKYTISKIFHRTYYSHIMFYFPCCNRVTLLGIAYYAKLSNIGWYLKLQSLYL